MTVASKRCACSSRSSPNLELAGSYLGGVSVADCIKGGREAARKLMNGAAQEPKEAGAAE